LLDLGTVLIELLLDLDVQTPLLAEKMSEAVESFGILLMAKVSLLLLLDHLGDHYILGDEGRATHPSREHQATNDKLQLLGCPLDAIIVDRSQWSQLQSRSSLLVQRSQVLLVGAISFLDARVTRGSCRLQTLQQLVL